MLNNQVEVLVKRQVLYREIDALLLNLSCVHASHKRILQFSDLCIAFERDKAVSSMRFFCVFYDMPPEVFFMSTTLFDSLLVNNQVSSMMFDILHISCFYVSAISYGHLIQFEDIIKFSSCTGNVDLLYSTTNFILAKLQASLEAVPTILSLLKLFLTILLPQPDVYFNIVPCATTKLELLVLCHKFNFYRADELVLALCHYVLKQIQTFDDGSINTRIIELLKRYQMDERQYCLCLKEIECHFHAYDTQKSVNPRLKLSWTISKKLLMKMKPSTKFSSKLEPLMESSEEISCFSDNAKVTDYEDLPNMAPQHIRDEVLKKEDDYSTFQSKLVTVNLKHLHKFLPSEKFQTCTPVNC